MGRKRKQQKTKPKRKLKDYEIDVDVIDLDSYVTYHTQSYLPLEYDDDDLMEIFIQLEDNDNDK
jgi:hypothetical protein